MDSISIFKRLADEYFSFLVTDLGFGKKEKTEELRCTIITHSYVKSSLFIEVEFTDCEKCAVLYFGRIGTDKYDIRYSFHTYLGLVDPSLYYKFGYSIAHKHEEIEELLKRYANALKTQGKEILENSDIPFEKLALALKSGQGLCPPYYMQPKNEKILSKFC